MPDVGSAGVRRLEATVAVPTLNSEDTIGECIDSVLNQNFHGFEVLVVDGGSTDNTVDKCTELGVGVLRQGRPGLTAARNEAIENARGTVVCFIDSDCIAPKDWVLRHVSAHTLGVDAVGGIYRNLHSDLLSEFLWGPRNVFHTQEFRLGQPYDLKLVNGYLKRGHLVGANFSIRREVAEGIGGFDEEFGYALEDYAITRRLLESGARVILDSSNIVYHNVLPSVRYLMTKIAQAKGEVLYRKKIHRKWYPRLNFLGVLWSPILEMKTDYELGIPLAKSLAFSSLRLFQMGAGFLVQWVAYIQRRKDADTGTL